MVTISLDEFGDFEQNDNGQVYIGGALFDDRENLDEYWKEKGRIHAYLQQVCDLAVDGCCYPLDLHVCKGRSNSKRVGQVKEVLKETIGDFLRRGSFRYNDQNYETGPVRTGKYIIYAIVKSEAGIHQLHNLNGNILSRDNYAGNTYLHMAENVLDHVLLHYPYHKIQDAALYLATRATPDLEQDGTLDVEFRTLHGQDEKYYRVTTSDIYHVALDRSILDSGRTDIHIREFNVKSIDYSVDRYLLYDPAEGQEFLYLADVICEILKHKNCEAVLHRKHRIQVNDSVRISEMKKTADFYTGHNQNLILGYDDSEVLFMRAWRKTENDELYDALSIAYDAKQMTSAFALFYEDNWYPLLHHYMKEKCNDVMLMNAIRSFSRSTYANNLNARKLLFIYKHLSVLVNENKNAGSKMREVQYEFYDAGMSAFNHLGHSKNAMKCYRNCRKLAENVSICRYLATLNKESVALQDQMSRDEAVLCALESVKWQQHFAEAANQIYPKETKTDGRMKKSVNISYAKALSQLGQAYAFSDDEKTKAGAEFEKAISLLDVGEPDWYITVSYYLHYLIEMNRKADYEKLAADYFGSSDLTAQFNNILEECGDGRKYDMRFALYVYVKGLLKFYSDRIPNALAERVLNADNIIKAKNGELNEAEGNHYEIIGHPWELIFTEIGLLALNLHMSVIAQKAVDEIRKLNQRAFGIVLAAGLYGEIRILEQMGKKTVIEWRQLKELLSGDDFAVEESQLTEAGIRSMMVYMYS